MRLTLAYCHSGGNTYSQQPQFYLSSVPKSNNGYTDCRYSSKLQSVVRNLMRLLKVAAFFLLLHTSVAAQSKFSALKQAIQKADAVVIINYESKMDSIKILRFLIPTLNSDSSFITEKKALNSAQRLKLLDILVRDERIIGRTTRTRIFTPQSAILIRKGESYQFIDLCKRCNSIDASEQLEVDDIDFGKQKWKELDAFFRQYGLKME